jgi:predicted metalloprotease
MMIRALATTAGVFVLLFAGTTAASAGPIVGVPELTHNPLYKQGRLPAISCKATKGTTKASTTKYLNKVVGCLNSAWRKTIKDFVPASVDVKTNIKSGLCFTGLQVSGSFASSCSGLIQVQLGSDWINAKSDQAILVEVTRAYAGFIQGQTGIGKAWWALPTRDEKDGGKEQTHRYYLQADCLGGVSMKVLGRSARNWKPLLAAETPKEYGRFNWYGKPANRLHWFDQGYKSQGPSACNTWKAPSSKVA